MFNDEDKHGIIRQEAAERAKAKPVTLAVRHRGPVGIRFVHDKDDQQVVMRPNEDYVEADFHEGVAERLVDHSEKGIGDIEVKGHEPKLQRRDQRQPSRQDIEDLERRNLEEARGRSTGRPLREGSGEGNGEGQEGDAKKTRADLEAMTKDDLRTYVESMGVTDVPASATKGDLIDAAVKAQRKS